MNSLVENEQKLKRLIENLTLRWKSLPVKSLLPVFPLLAQGKPVSIKKIAEINNTTTIDLQNELKSAPVEWNQRNEIINVFGFKFTPTPHQLNFAGVITYCCCALWLHFLPRLVGSTAVVESIDPVNNQKIELTITPAGVESVQPTTATAVLVDTTIENMNSNLGANFCSHIRLFYDENSSSKWINADSKRYLIDLKTLDKVAQEMCSNIWFKQR